MEWLSTVAEEYGLFVVAVIYIIWDSRQREDKYIKVIDKFGDSYKQIESDVKKIKDKLWG
ncbi:hypothetical protein RJD24_12350 [Bacillaceae bacterium IKA-2]|nr:hypothetical protein RJD24_12350 [Bacillaceae bacterium IKA-2]